MFDQITCGRRALLMERAKGGDGEAFRALLTDIRPLITNFLRRRVADRHELEDVCQETLIAIYESRHTYEASRPLEPWIFAIARYVGARHFRDHLSRTSRHKLIDEIAENLGTDGGERIVEVRRALQKLSCFQREAFLMTKLEGLSLSEASVRAGVSVAALKVRVHRAREFIRRTVLE